MTAFDPHLRWIDQQHTRMCRLVSDWANINSGTNNLPGLGKLSAELRREFACLGGEMIEVSLRPHASVDARGNKIQSALAPAISIRKHPDAPVRIFLGIHMDTVYGPDHPFQRVERMDEHTLRGPGVADAKGGLCVMLIALEALERSEWAGKIGWEVLINSDEEIGSPGSAPLLAEAGRRNQVGLVYEPAFADGALVGERKGSANYSVIVRGRSAHAGRDFHHGRNAMHAAAALVVELDRINHAMPGVTVNVGRIDGGGPANVVPDLAIVRFNVRLPPHENPERIEAAIQHALEEIKQRDGISVELTGGFSSPPKPMNRATQRLFDSVIDCGRQLGMTLSYRSSGGVSDGNKLAAVGLPVVDTLGAVGGNLHSAEEFLLLDSLTERAKLSALLMMSMGAGEWEMGNGKPVVSAVEPW